MDGKIVEQGSHDQLIDAKGKYHDLWSKQISVNPKDEQSKSRSSQNSGDDLINDLNYEGIVPLTKPETRSKCDGQTQKDLDTKVVKE